MASKTNGELQRIEPSAPRPDPLAILQNAVTRGVDAAQLEKLMDLSERWYKMQAEQQFNDALAKCQHEIHECPVIKAETNPHTRSKYASLDAIAAAVVPIYSRHGFSLTFGQGEPVEAKKADHIRLVATLRHAGGFSREYWLDLPLDGQGSQGGRSAMNRVQALGSTVTYGRRYLICPIFNVALRGEDTDGNMPEPADGPINVEQRESVNRLIDECHALGASEKFLPGFVSFMGITSIAEMPRSKFAAAVKNLQGRRKQLEERRRSEDEQGSDPTRNTQSGTSRNTTSTTPDTEPTTSSPTFPAVEEHGDAYEGEPAEAQA